MFVRYAALEMHPLDTNDRRTLLKEKAGPRPSATSPSAAPRSARRRIHITDNAIIPLKERVVDGVSLDPLRWAWRKLTGADSGSK